MHIDEFEITEEHHNVSKDSLHATVENFRAILNSVGDAMITIDTGSLITGMNPKAEYLTGWQEKEAKGMPLTDILHFGTDKDGIKIEYPINQCLSEDQIVGYAGHPVLISKDGTQYRISVSCAPIKNTTGQKNGVVLVLRDMTEEFALQERIITSEQQLRSLYDSMTEGVCQHEMVYDASGRAINYRIIDVNKMYEEIIAVDRIDVIGKLASDVYNTQEAPYLDIFANVAQTGKPIRFEFYFQPLDKHFYVSVCSPGKDKFATIFKDISERKRTEEQFRLQSAALEASANAIMITDRDGIIELINPAFTKLTGYSAKEAIGKNPRDLVKSDKHDAMFYKNIWDTILAGSVWHGDIINRRKDGSLYNEEQTIAPVMDAAGRISHFVAIKQDVTDRKIADQMLREQQIELTKLNSQLEKKIDIQLAELHLAAQIQRNLLPNETPVLSGYDISALNIPANEIGGDYFDFLRLDEHRTVIVLGDVSGKGLSAALLMANLQAVIRGQALYNSTPMEYLERANNLLFHSTDSDKFVTLFYGILDTQKNTLQYVNAGHNLPILYSSGNVPVSLETSGLPLGAFEDITYEEKEITIAIGDQLLIYSDGVCEALNDDFEEFGENKLLQIIGHNGHMHPKDLEQKITSALKMHIGESPQSDDITMVLVKRN